MRFILVPAVAFVMATAAAGQGVPTPVPIIGIDPVFSMGQPRKIQPHASLVGMLNAGADASGRLVVGAHKSFMNPVSGMIGVTAEGFVDGPSTARGGVRLLATSRAVGLSAGIEQGLVGDQETGLAFSYQTAVRRGGLLRRGTMLRLDWLPRGDGSVGVGVQMPLLQPFAGITRERVTAIRVNKAAETRAPRPELISSSVNVSLTRAAGAATQISAFTNLYTPSAELALLTSPGRDYFATLEAYENAMAESFLGAVGDPAAGRRAHRAARAILLGDVLLPFNAIFGQAKVGRGVGGLTNAATDNFASWVRDSLPVGADRQAAVEAVYARWLSIVESVERDLLSQWKDSRLVWLPLQLGLTLDEYDDQAEVDALIARAVGRPFTDQNALAYLNSTELPLEIARTIYATRDYHVLWTHDFAGRRFTGTLDNIGFSMVADAYLPALTEAVKRYDSTGVMPVYMILLDQYFYEPNDGRLWMTILQDPLNASMRLPGDPVREAHLKERQRILRAAVAASPRLRQEASRGVDPRDVVKVHVNITHPSDFSFRSKRIIPPLPFTPDNLMRDHRKVAVYDVNEADPYRGALILMGVGIGEHYASPTWEDRGYRIRGPAALEARGAIRRLLHRMGFRTDQIPIPLRATASAPATEQAMNRGDYIGRALQVHNEPGFGSKESSIARATLYNLATPGSIIIAPDPLWLSETWAGMLAAAAARGSRVFVIAPAFANAPSPQAPLMAQAHGVMGRLIALQRGLIAQAAANGGELRIGLYAAEAQIDDVNGRVREIRDGLQRAPWIRGVIPFDSTTLAVLIAATAAADAAGGEGTRLARDEKPRAPQLHQKTQLIALPGAMAALVRQPSWRGVLAQSIRAQTQQTAKFTDQLEFTTPDVDTTAMRRNDALLTAYEQSRPEAERARVSFYFSVGTQNQDARGLASDGEATVVVSGFHAAAGVVDLYNIMARSRWITTEQELDQYLPPPSSLMRRLVRWIKATL